MTFFKKLKIFQFLEKVPSVPDYRKNENWKIFIFSKNEKSALLLSKAIKIKIKIQRRFSFDIIVQLTYLTEFGAKGAEALQKISICHL